MFESIPDVLKATPQWIVYKAREEDGKTDKIPVDPTTGRNVNAHDPTNWMDFGRAVAASARCAGIGFVFTEGDRFAGIDLDKCIGADGKPEPWAEQVIDCFQSYSERSPSKEGVHIIIVGRMPAGSAHKVNGQGPDGRGAIETYDRKRFFTFTGDPIDGSPTGVFDRQEEFEAFCRARMAKGTRGDDPAGDPRPNRTPDEDVIRFCRSFWPGARFVELYDEGDLSRFGGDWSRADMALCDFLCFWSGGDRAQIDRLFRRSALMREKWDEPRAGTTYGGYTVEKVVSTAKAFYDPGAETDPDDSQPPDDEGSKGLDGALGRMPMTDLGNAERLVARHVRDLRYCHPWDCWLVWDGRRWAIDKAAAARHRARETVRAIGREASREGDDERRKALFKWALTSEKRDRISALLYLAEAEQGVPILPESLNTDPFAFNCANGTVDLRTGRLRRHRRDDLITQLCAIEYEPDAGCPLWLATLDRFFHRDDPAVKGDLIGYWQRLCGYAMVGVVRDHILPIAYGTGSNGKSTILGALLDTFGPDYAMKAPPGMLMAKRDDSHPTERADLFGKRLVVAIETEAGGNLSEVMIKELTGGDAVRARRMRQDFWEFKPTHTLIMATNHKPAVRGTDTGIWRRLKLIPFTVSMTDQDADTSMPGKLKSEAAGILAWCVRGCLAWQSRGLDAPGEITEATGKYRRDQDVLGLFLGELTVVGPWYRVKAGELYAGYKNWAEGGNERVMTQTAFGLALEERGFEKKKSGGNWYMGLSLRQNDGVRNQESE
jgi:putative DNA primase/helicase